VARDDTWTPLRKDFIAAARWESGGPVRIPLMTCLLFLAPGCIGLGGDDVHRDCARRATFDEGVDGQALDRVGDGWAWSQTIENVCAYVHHSVTVRVETTTPAEGCEPVSELRGRVYTALGLMPYDVPIHAVDGIGDKTFHEGTNPDIGYGQQAGREPKTMVVEVTVLQPTGSRPASTCIVEAVSLVRITVEYQESMPATAG
jgi:hypothetical protein